MNNRGHPGHGHPTGLEIAESVRANGRGIFGIVLIIPRRHKTDQRDGRDRLDAVMMTRSMRG